MIGVTLAQRTVTLDKFLPGQAGKVLDVDLSGPLGRRLLELGVVPGRRATLLRAAPLGDPLEIQLPNAYISLRRYEASLVRMTLEF